MWGPLTESLQVLVETTDSALAVGKYSYYRYGDGYDNYISGGYDYHPVYQTITFEPTDNMRSERCLEIEIIDDSLAESFEMFTVLLSTNSSTTVNVTRHYFNVFIRPNDGIVTIKELIELLPSPHVFTCAIILL